MRLSNLFMSGLALLTTQLASGTTSDRPAILAELEMTGSVTDFDPINEVVKFVGQEFCATNYC
jgi:hypothetical protein